MPPRPKPERQRAKHYFREWRERRFPNQEDAIAPLGWSQSKISRLESGRTPYDQDDLETAAEVFGCSKIDLISWPPDAKGDESERHLRTALLAFGVDGKNLSRAVATIRAGFVKVEESPEQTPPDGQSEPSNPRHAKAPSE